MDRRKFLKGVLGAAGAAICVPMVVTTALADRALDKQLFDGALDRPVFDGALDKAEGLDAYYERQMRLAEPVGADNKPLFPGLYDKDTYMYIEQRKGDAGGHWHQRAGEIEWVPPLGSLGPVTEIEITGEDIALAAAAKPEGWPYHESYLLTYSTARATGGHGDLYQE